jgi:hypothetical protein
VKAAALAALLALVVAAPAPLALRLLLPAP